MKPMTIRQQSDSQPIEPPRLRSSSNGNKNQGNGLLQTFDHGPNLMYYNLKANLQENSLLKMNKK